MYSKSFKPTALLMWQLSDKICNYKHNKKLKGAASNQGPGDLIIF